MTMNKRVLVVSYSQSGQLARLKESFLRDIRGTAGIEVDDVVLQPAQPFAFPWRLPPVAHQARARPGLDQAHDRDRRGR